MIVRFSVRAFTDIDEIVSYITERSPSGARAVLRAIYAGIRLLAEQPFASPVTNDPQVRVKTIRRYRYKIFYRVSGEVVDILHIRHTSRAPVNVDKPRHDRDEVASRDPLLHG